ncbi:MAG: biotin--[acetyl-CoA-carboxylase] ligase [Bacteroidales bacterium]|jgi:BirA family biotin operon repressor/biotin-[acetyl-CoA-carboxylase] ligase|nr:biotin--[acetyl-CoA-carboxylase] ligase [Bacteroidales bacterium]
MNHRFKIKTVGETISTNLLMQELEKAGKLINGDVIRAINQTGGIGQSGNYWESENGKNLTFSLFLETHFLAAEDVFQLNKVVSLAIYDYLLEKKLTNVKIKWPNDVYVGNKKIAGMLTHNSFLGEKLEHSIVGIGININQIEFKRDAPNPISLKQIAQINYDLEDELNGILQFIYMRIIQMAKGGFLQLNTDYLERLYGMDKKQKFKDSEGSFNGIIKGVDSFGRLLVEKDTGDQFTYDIKEIEFL